MDHERVAATSRHPGAGPGCARCGGTGWALGGDPVRAALCGCVGPCPRCGGGGFLAGGLESCACRIARERQALVTAARLPASPGGVLGAEASAWFAAYRPEPDRAWLLVWGEGRDAVTDALIGLISGVGVPVDRAEPPAEGSSWRRLVLAPELERWDRASARRLVELCASRSLTLVATSVRPPWPEHGEGLEAVLGDAVALALVERATISGR